LSTQALDHLARDCEVEDRSDAICDGGLMRCADRDHLAPQLVVDRAGKKIPIHRGLVRVLREVVTVRAQIQVGRLHELKCIVLVIFDEAHRPNHFGDQLAPL